VLDRDLPVFRGIANILRRRTLMFGNRARSAAIMSRVSSRLSVVCVRYATRLGSAT